MKLVDLPPDSELVGPPPTRELVEKITTYGVLIPILVRLDGERFKVIEGRRRVKAARAIGLTSIPARVTDVRGRAMSAALTVVTHSTRNENAAAEFDAINSLLVNGASEQDLVEATGLPVQTIRKRMSLGSLTEDLMDLFRQGKIAPSAAEAAAKLPQERQQDLWCIYESNGKVTSKDVSEVRRVCRAEASAALPFDEIERTPERQPDRLQEWQARAVTLLEKLSSKVSRRDLKVIEELLREARS